MSLGLLSQRTLQYILDLLRGSIVLGLFAIGFALAAAGLIALVNTPFGDPGASAILQIVRITVLALGLLLCGWVLTSFAMSLLRSHARIVPYYRQPLGVGVTIKAFAHGRGLFRELQGLDKLARSLRVTPVSDFGFRDDYYFQRVTWHSAADGLRTFQSLQESALRDGSGFAADDLIDDLEAIVAALRTAEEKVVDFALVLRQQDADEQGASLERDQRRGALW